jgi:hypothetical protein
MGNTVVAQAGVVMEKDHFLCDQAWHFFIHVALFWCHSVVL